MKLKVSRIISQGRHNEKKFGSEPDAFHKSLYFIPQELTEKNVSDVLSYLYVLAKHYPKLKEEQKEIYQLRKNLIEQMCFQQVSNYLHMRRLNNPKLEDYLKEVVYPYYKGRFTSKMSREISFLPLELRLYLYVTLYHLEQSKMPRWYLLERICVTLSKMGDSFTSTSLFSLNWLYILEMGKESHAHHQFKEAEETFATSHDWRKDILTERGYTPDQLFDELQHCISQFISPELIHDSKSAVMMLELFATYFEDIPQMSQYKESIQLFLKSGNPNHIETLKNLKKGEIVPQYKGYYENGAATASQHPFWQALQEKKYEESVKEFVRLQNHYVEQETVVTAEDKTKPPISKNAPCPCGSGQKYKKCCGKEIQI